MTLYEFRNHQAFPKVGLIAAGAYVCAATIAFSCHDCGEVHPAPLGGGYVVSTATSSVTTAGGIFTIEVANPMADEQTRLPTPPQTVSGELV